MKKLSVFAALLLLIACLLPLAVSAQNARIPYVSDPAGVLSDADRLTAENAMKTAAAETGCSFSAVIFRSDKYEYWGEDYLADLGVSESTDLVLLIVTIDSGKYYYDLYLYGKAGKEIRGKEIDAILDANGVYGNLKSGKLADGIVSFAGEATAAYLNTGKQSGGKNRYLTVLPFAILISAVVGAIVCFVIRRNYSGKKKPVEYPFKEFTDMKLTLKTDTLTGRFVTKRVIESSSSSSRGGGSSHGGGSGHAGGR